MDGETINAQTHKAMQYTLNKDKWQLEPVTENADGSSTIGTIGKSKTGLKIEPYPPIPCSEEFIQLHKDDEEGRRHEEGKDFQSLLPVIVFETEEEWKIGAYEARHELTQLPTKHAYPIVKEQQEDLWEELVELYDTLAIPRQSDLKTTIIGELSKHFTIQRKQLK